MRSFLLKSGNLIYQLLGVSGNSSWKKNQTNLNIAPSAILGGGSRVIIGNAPQHPAVCIEVGEQSQIFARFVIQRPDAFIRVGRRTHIGASHIIAAKGVTVGDDVLIAWDVTVIDHDSHSLMWSERKDDVLQFGIDYQNYPEDPVRNKDWSNVSMSEIRIQNKAWIGFGASILKGVTIGEGAVIAACSVVTKDVLPYTLVAGNPAVTIRQLETSEPIVG